MPIHLAPNLVYRMQRREIRCGGTVHRAQSSGISKALCYRGGLCQTSGGATMGFGFCLSAVWSRAILVSGKTWTLRLQAMPLSGQCYGQDHLSQDADVLGQVVLASLSHGHGQDWNVRVGDPASSGDRVLQDCLVDGSQNTQGHGGPRRAVSAGRVGRTG
jgi:hypothetical protein